MQGNAPNKKTKDEINYYDNNEQNFKTMEVIEARAGKYQDFRFRYLF